MLSTSSDNSRPSSIRSQQRKGRCPTCGHDVAFHYCGEQRWPAHIAKAAGVDPVVRLWSCNTCNSTISEQSIQ
jgi:hypothetical protein